MKLRIIHKIDHGNGITESHSDIGMVIWKKNGLRHRDNDEYAVRYIDGSCEWWQKGKMHREGKPAVVVPFYREEWWKKGKKHRDDGPAVLLSNGTEEYWHEGIKITEQEFNAIYLNNNLPNQNIVNRKKLKL